MKYIFFLSLPLYALDQLTKSCVLQFIKPDQPHIVIAGFFDLVNIINTGAAFGSFKDNNTFFIAISCLALLFVVFLLVRRRTADAWRDISLALLLAGVLGNLTDRLLYGHVVDFLLFDLHVPFAHFYRGGLFYHSFLSLKGGVEIARDIVTAGGRPADSAGFLPSATRLSRFACRN